MLVAKYADHLPLYRQEQIYARSGVKIPRSTLAEWVGVCGVRLQPLVDALRAAILNEPVVHVDETPVQVLQPGNKKTHRAYLWAYAPGAFQAASTPLRAPLPIPATMETGAEITSAPGQAMTRKVSASSTLRETAYTRMDRMTMVGV